MIEVPNYETLEEFKKHACCPLIPRVTIQAVIGEPNKIIKKLKWFWNGEESG